MQKRGPKAKDRASPRTLKAVPKAPKTLEAAARKHWDAVAKLLNESGHGSALDVEAMSFYLTIWTRWRKAEYMLGQPPAAVPGEEGGGEVITTVNGYRQLNPWYTVAKETLRELKGYLAEFGLSPKARAKLLLPEAEESGGKWEDFD
jgi:P27 family predicted phage terminase small subunit